MPHTDDRTAGLPDDDAAEEAWREEIRRQRQEIDSGAVKLIPWQDVRQELLDRLAP